MIDRPASEDGLLTGKGWEFSVGVFDRFCQLADDDIQQVHRFDIDAVLVVGVVRDEDACAVVLALQGVHELRDGDGLAHGRLPRQRR